jgi:O-antigen/teichoic acid export membrane protein
VLFPKISSLKSVESNNLTPRISRHTFFITIFLSLVLAILAKPLIKLFFGITFLPSLIPLLILLPGIIALSVSKVLTADLAGRGKPQYGTYSSFVSLLLNILLNLWLIPRWGISGAAFATTVAYILSTLLVINFFIKISNKSYFEILVIKKQDLQEYRKILVNIRNRIVK